jgi:hypothetical protein
MFVIICKCPGAGRVEGKASKARFNVLPVLKQSKIGAAITLASQTKRAKISRVSSALRDAHGLL